LTVSKKQYEIEVKLKLVELVKAALEKRKKLPSEIRLDAASVIRDPKKFFDSHLAIISANHSRLRIPYAKRVALALTDCGIDIYELKRKAEQQIKKQISK
jgi:hypothetical protein